MSFCVSPISLKNPRKIADSSIMRIPCGKCGACLQKRRTDWTFRIQEEHRVSSSAWFLTLTLSDENMEYSNEGIETVEKRTLQLFLKRLRKLQYKYSDEKIRYYAVGEYGSKTGRPHYHAIIFNMDVEVIAELPSVWPKGNIRAAPLNAARIHYTTKYHVNAHSYPEYDDLRTPEFSLMSRKPGIGHSYVERAKKWHNENLTNYVDKDGHKLGIPQYLKEKIFTPGQRKGLAQRSLSEAEKNYIAQLQKLAKLKNPNPFVDLEMRAIVKALQYIQKSKNSDKL